MSFLNIKEKKLISLIRDYVPKVRVFAVNNKMIPQKEKYFNIHFARVVGVLSYLAYSSGIPEDTVTTAGGLLVADMKKHGTPYEECIRIIEVIGDCADDCNSDYHSYLPDDRYTSAASTYMSYYCDWLDPEIQKGLISLFKQYALDVATI